MHAADPGTHLSQRRQERLHLLRIPHDHRKRYRANFLYSAGSPWFRAPSWPPAPHGRSPGLRKPLQEVAALSDLRFDTAPNNAPPSVLFCSKQTSLTCPNGQFFARHTCTSPKLPVPLIHDTFALRGAANRKSLFRGVLVSDEARFLERNRDARNSETYKNSGPLLLGDGPAPGRGQSAGARDPEGAFKSRSRLSRNGEETPPYGRREGASCDRPQRTDQGNEGPRRSSGARECSRRNAEELEVRPGQRRNNHPAGVQFPSVSPSGFCGFPCKILITRQGQCALVLRPFGEDRRSKIPAPAGKHLSKKFLERLPIVAFPSCRQVIRIAFGKSSMVKHDPRPRSLFHKLKPRNRVNARGPTARPPGLDNTFIRHKLDLPPRDVAREE